MRQGPGSDGDSWERFQHLLDSQTEWPSKYVFKFIAPSERLDELKAALGGHPVVVRESSKGNYISVTATIEVYSSEHVVAVYEAVSDIDDVILL
jgi:uncharacterized protein